MLKPAPEIIGNGLKVEACNLIDLPAPGYVASFSVLRSLGNPSCTDVVGEGAVITRRIKLTTKGLVERTGKQTWNNKLGIPLAFLFFHVGKHFISQSRHTRWMLNPQKFV